jgi:DNA repair protein RadC
MSAVDIGKRVLQLASNNLNQLATLSAKQLMNIRGIGEARAITIVAALELGRRRKEVDPEERPKIGGSIDAFQLLRSEFQDIPYEAFWIILLNRANRVIRKYQVSQGGVTGTVADPKIIFKAALEELASVLF